MITEQPHLCSSRRVAVQVTLPHSLDLSCFTENGSWKRHLFWCIRANDREFMTPSSLSMAPKPVLQAKVVFHALIALAITLQLPR
jgi:hypothetical protein